MVTTTTITPTKTAATIGSATLNGRIWKVTPHLPWAGDTTAEAIAIRAMHSPPVETDVQCWLGIRYAVPPIGDNRWKDAQAYTYAAGTYEMNTWPDVPIQNWVGSESDEVGRAEWPGSGGIANWRGYGVKESEDCLTLNIWAPSADLTPPTGGWPVIFMVHGGGWGVNSAIQYRQRGHRLAAYKGCIVICPEYRMSDFGYFSHPSWSTGVSGPNFAFTDTKLALKWVYDNVASFGGNKNKLLVSGTSAGGANTLMFMESDDVQSYFSSAWAMSGGGNASRMDATGRAARYERFMKAVRGSASWLRDYSRPGRSVAAAILADGEANAIRTALSPEHITAFSMARRRVSKGSIQLQKPEFVQGGNENVYPFIGNGLTYTGSTNAAIAGKFRKPIVIAAALDEHSNFPGSQNYSDAQINSMAGWFGLTGPDWLAAAWWPPGTTRAVKNRKAYDHFIFQYHAWRQAYAVVDTASAPYCYLLLNGWSEFSLSAHSSDVPLCFGNIEWSTWNDVVSGEVRVTARLIRHSESCMQMIANMAWKNSPNTADFTFTGKPELVPTPTRYTINTQKNNPTDKMKWNVLGTKVTGSTITAPNSVSYTDFDAAAFESYKAGSEP